jgi:hypothetical protein
VSANTGYVWLSIRSLPDATIQLRNCPNSSAWLTMNPATIAVSAVANPQPGQ